MRLPFAWRWLGAALVAAVLPAQLAQAPAALAQSAADFPSKPITMIVPWPAGGGTDLWHRALAESMSRGLGQSVVVDNKAGASGTAGPSAMAANAKPDGYTISHMPITMIRLPIMRKVSWDPLKDFSWIAHISGFQFATVVPTDSPFKTLNDMIEYARTNPGKLTYASPGSGTSLHIGMELIAKKAGIQWTQVPFKGSQESVTALLGGHVMSMAGGSDWWPMYEAKQLRPVVLWTEKRSERVADIPTLQEVGFNYIFDSPFGLAGPKGMDPAVVKKLHDAIKVSLGDPKVIEVRKRFDLQDRYMDTAAYTAFIADLHTKETGYLTEIGLAKKE